MANVVGATDIYREWFWLVILVIVFFLLGPQCASLTSGSVVSLVRGRLVLHIVSGFGGQMGGGLLVLVLQSTLCGIEPG